ncbi:MAG: ABC transporter ATP-binding protein [Candidatus Nanogingivalaceae bacterium]|nr:MAG: ABC transporter ATP-binding protein [Candidatus Nanogingivalaceae bacterium]QWB91539.1 MAG: ABC transporter ATP-binding protein [Candidatus Nanogingivalaceae bacterium]
MIEVRNISKTYGKKKNSFQALKNVSFKIPKGASVAIIGKSGSGKSTLIHAMSGLDAPEEGEVLMDGVNILSMKQKDIDKFRSKKMGFIFQSFFVQGNETCFENVSLPLEIAEEPIFRRKEIIENALKAVGLEDKIKTPARDLSGGQKQRLAIARAIANSPEIIFADEPTGNLDSITSAKIEKMLFEYNKNSKATLLIVTHDEELAEKCDIRIRIKDGKVEQIEGVRNA